MKIEETTETTDEHCFENHNRMYSGIVYPQKVSESTIDGPEIGGGAGQSGAPMRYSPSQYERNRYPFVDEREGVGHFTKRFLQTLDSEGMDFSVYLPLLVLVVLMFLQKK
tara:strand:- start:854 stop:1183 length:330 start_codon:yes stop_codon:yes gene_type:complete